MNGFKYKVGMYGGSFDPLHLGHIHDIIRSASMCEELYVMISWCEGRESTSKELRYRWILNSTRHLPNVKIILIEDKAVSKEEYNTDYYWEKGANDIKNTIGKRIDVVFCGDDYLGSNRFESLYGDESEVIYFKRAEVPISSTEIRGWAMDNWDYIPAVCKPYYTKKVLVIGGESTGKSTLVQNLALAYNTNYVSEVGRDTCEYAGGVDYMLPDDFIENLLKQRLYVDEACKNSNRLLFVDTDAIVTKFYTKFVLGLDHKKFDKIARLADAITVLNSWDLVLFLEPTVAFVQDGTRSEEIQNNRNDFSEELKEMFLEKGVKITTISGDYLNRFNQAKKEIEAHLSVKTQW